MKTHSVALAAMFASHSNTLAWTLAFMRQDGLTLRYVQGREPVTIDGNVYLPAPGFNVSNLTMTLGIEVDSAELNVLTDDQFIIGNFLSGRWDGCHVAFRRYNYKDPAAGFDPFPLYRISDVTPEIGGFKIELRDFRQLWRQNFTRSLSKTCEYRLGDANCTKDLGAFTYAFTVDSVASRTQFTVAALGLDDEWFQAGKIIFASGLYEDLELLVRGSTGDVITLAMPLFADVTIGQTGTIIAGCLKRRDEDCVIKFDNVLNYGGVGVDAPTVGQIAGEDSP